MRDIFVTATVFALLPFCLVRPWIGVLAWSWLGYMNPHRLTWGFALTIPFAMMVGATTLVGFLFTRERKALPRVAALFFLLALWGFFLLTTLNALRPMEAWDQFDKVSKILLMTVVTIFLFQEWTKLRYLFYVIALSIGFYGLKGGIWAIGTGGGNQVLGPPGTFIEGNTEIGLALNMVLPLLLFLSRDATKPWLRKFILAMLGFSVVAVLFTYSRGAFLGLMIVLPLMFMKTRMRLLVLPLALVAYLVGPSLLQAVMPDAWLERMGTIKTYDEDRSANMRLNSWRVSYLLTLDYPLLGGGFRPFSPAIYLRYSPLDMFNSEPLNTDQDAHSIYFQVMAEHGFTGLALYLGLIVTTMIGLRRTIWRAGKDPTKRPIRDAAQMIEVSLIGFLVTGTFLSMSYFDLFFHLVACSMILGVLARQPAAAPTPKPVSRTTGALARR